MDKVNELIAALQKLVGRNELCWPKDKGDYRLWFNMNLEDPDLQNAEGLACEALISQGGDCNWENIHELKSRGYDVERGDGDSFGWLTGVITIPNVNGNPYVLVYG